MTTGKETRRELIFFVLLLATAMGADAQRVRGELHLEVRDPQGAALTPNAELDCDVNQLRRSFQVAADGRYIAQDLPFGVYRLSISARGFAPWTSMIEIRSEVPLHLSVTLGVAPVTTQVEVSDRGRLSIRIRQELSIR